MARAVVRAERLSKDYAGHRGVDDLTFEVAEGEVFGYLGPNGAGKTTTIRLLLDLIRPTSGRIELFGLDVRRAGPKARGRLGYLPGDLRLYERLTPREHLRYFASLRGMSGLGDGEGLAERLELELDRPIRALSKGNRQKVGLVQALMHRPALAVFDEPTSGLDPLVQQVVYELVAEATADGRTVFVSSHVLSEVQHIAHRVALIRDGRLELVDDVESLRQRARSRVEVSFAEPPPTGAFDGLEGVREVGRNGDVVRLTLEGSADPLVKALARYEVRAIDSHEADLEEVFLELYRRPAGAR
ncbi:MAG TPA: ABC transporter ATP-binding protein [Gaiella sp.]|jgi:ABC-2 type transport system ATP-binding protein|nr:ABC transporter ATP-binding protein [Gaiella sp.]